MKQYIVIHVFKDLEDDNYIYNKIGAPYPRAGVNIEDIPQERINDLTSSNNNIGVPLIRAIEIESNIETKEQEASAEETAETKEQEASAEETAETKEQEASAEETAETKNRNTCKRKSKIK